MRLTPPGRGAVATLSVEGPGALAAVASLFCAQSGRPLEAGSPDRPVFGHFGPPGGEEVVVRCRSDSWIELHCHGGHAAIARIEQLLVERGGRAVSWPEWAAVQREDPITVAARIALADARTQRTALILLDQFCGALRRAIRSLQQSLAAGQTEAALGQVDALLACAPLGLHLTAPWHAVLAGAPNVGKSSLINALAGYARAIVHPMPGTTRDVVTASTAVDGWPVEFSDTAGLRSTTHPVEQAGVELARQKMAAADLLLLVFDSSRTWSATDNALCDSWPGAILVHNKADLRACSGPRPQGLLTSALTGEGLERLLEAIAARLVPEVPPAGAAVPFTAGQIGLLRRVRDALADHDPAFAQAILAQVGSMDEGVDTIAQSGSELR